MPGRHSINKDRERPAGTAGEQVIERIGVLALGMRRLDRVQRSYMTMRNKVPTAFNTMHVPVVGIAEAERRGKCIAIRLSVHKELNSRNASQSVGI